MGKLCERPGCSEAAALAYGMRPDDQVFWLDVLGDWTSPESGVLCLRHGNTMVVPLGWTLDDQRDPDLHLFRPPMADVEEPPTLTPRRIADADDTQQLELRVHLDDEMSAVTADDRETGPADGAVDRADPDRWTPAFDDADDLDGLLSARSPLLSRAFRGGDRTG